MDWLTPLLPITVVAAIVLFLLKELFEAIRRWHADERKRRAFRILLARECELNYWAYTRLKQTLETVQAGLEQTPSENFAIIEGDYHDIRFEHYLESGLRGSWPLSDFHADRMDRVMLDVATLDQTLYEGLSAAYDAVANLKHVRQTLIELVSSGDEDDQAHLSAFPEYGLGELARALPDLKFLYKTCTGKTKIPARLR